MATTKAKESSLGKERKITAPSSVTIPNTPAKRTPKSSPRGLSADHKLPSFSSSSPSSSTLSEKHIPNYLKSTASSRHDHNHTFKPVKKPGPIPEGKPLNRRRSFDKPPPTAPRLDKPFRSPGPRCRATHVPLRSSSFGAKPTTFVSSAKPGFLERSVSKISKVGKSQQPVQNLKSSGTAKKSLKKELSKVSSALAEMVPKTKNAIEHGDQGPMVLGTNDEDLKKIECELDCYLPDPMPELNKELITDPEEKKVGVLVKEEADKKDEVEKKLHHHQPTRNTDISDKEVEETPPAAETENPEEAEAKSSTMEEENRDPNEQVGEEEAKDEEKAEGTAAAEEVVVASEEHENDNKEEKIAMEQKGETEQKWEGGEGVVEEENNKNTTKVEAAEKEAEATEKDTEAAAAEKAAATAGKQRQGGGTGRKESPAVYNDVIEETASKLLEKRKNKVKALAGAFQTVIDYESSSK